MDVDARRDMIVGIATPLLLQHGTALTSRQIAEATGLAEGTIYRAFGDKDSLVAAVLERYYDPQIAQTAFAAIPPGLPLDDLLLRILQISIERVRQVVQMMTAMGGRGPEKDDPPSDDTLRALLEPHRRRLRLPVKRTIEVLTALAVTSALPIPADDRAVTPEELVDLLMNGVVNR